MTASFTSKVKQYDYPLFYNSEGSKEAYQLYIRHLSASQAAGLATISQGYVIPNDTLHLVNLEEEMIELISTPIRLVKLKTLP
ncbi:MAG TPA: hypothetical protein ENK82_01070 [Campylobacterales bacterium]|nr:hypothetical protein [Campylobacterales bacterium]HHS91916.1 hypothetical protein [Campylobacterales bacterium]